MGLVLFFVFVFCVSFLSLGRLVLPFFFGWGSLASLISGVEVLFFWEGFSFPLFVPFCFWGDLVFLGFGGPLRVFVGLVFWQVFASSGGLGRVLFLKFVGRKTKSFKESRAFWKPLSTKNPLKSSPLKPLVVFFFFLGGKLGVCEGSSSKGGGFGPRRPVKYLSPLQ